MDSLLKIIIGKERLYPGGICPTRLGMCVWILLVDDNDRARRLGHYPMVLS